MALVFAGATRRIRWFQPTPHLPLVWFSDGGLCAPPVPPPLFCCHAGINAGSYPVYLGIPPFNRHCLAPRSPRIAQDWRDQ